MARRTGPALRRGIPCPTSLRPREARGGHRTANYLCRVSRAVSGSPPQPSSPGERPRRASSRQQSAGGLRPWQQPFPPRALAYATSEAASAVRVHVPAPPPVPCQFVAGHPEEWTRAARNGAVGTAGADREAPVGCAPAPPVVSPDHRGPPKTCAVRRILAPENVWRWVRHETGRARGGCTGTRPSAQNCSSSPVSGVEGCSLEGGWGRSRNQVATCTETRPRGAPPPLLPQVDEERG